MEDKSKTTGIGHFLAQFDKDNSAWLVANGFPDDLDRAVKIAVAELGEFVTSQDIADFPLDNIWDLLQTCVDRREWLEARALKPAPKPAKPGPEFSNRKDAQDKYFTVWAYVLKPGNANKSNVQIGKATHVNKDMAKRIREETRPPSADEIEEHRTTAKKS